VGLGCEGRRIRTFDRLLRRQMLNYKKSNKIST
jgi:hypothetical protein